MGGNTSVVGGTPNAGLPADFSNFLRSLIGGNTAGGDQMSSIGNAIRSMLSMDINDPANANLNTALNQQKEKDIGDINARFNLSGLSYSTPAAVGNADYLASSAPNIMNAMGARQMQALSLLFPALGNLTQLGTPQAQVVSKPSTFQDIMGGLTGLTGAALPFFSPGGLFASKGLPSAPNVGSLNPGYIAPVSA
jgi:hypothetical protein